MVAEDYHCNIFIFKIYVAYILSHKKELLTNKNISNIIVIKQAN